MSSRLHDAMELAYKSEEGRAAIKTLFDIKKENAELLKNSGSSNPEMFGEFIKNEREMEEAFIRKIERKRGAKTPRFKGFPEDDDDDRNPRPNPSHDQTTNVSLAPALPTTEFTTTHHSDGTLKTVFHQKVTQDTPMLGTAIGAFVCNRFPTPTTDRSNHIYTLAFLADVASYWCHSTFVPFVANTLSNMVTNYLPNASREAATKEVAEFVGMISIHSNETLGAVNKLKSILDKFWDAPRPAENSKRGPPPNYSNFRNSVWVKEASEPLLKSLGLKK